MGYNENYMSYFTLDIQTLAGKAFGPLKYADQAPKYNLRRYLDV